MNCKALTSRLMLALALALVLGITGPAAAQGNSVVIIGGSTLGSCDNWWGSEANNMGATAGGCLPVTGPVGELGDFSFAAMLPSDVSAANLAPYDIAVLNVASTAMSCNTDTLSAQQKADLVAFVEGGKKLIIYDSECYPVGYSWLPFPFTTANPGAMGAPGTLTIVEDNTLSSNDTADEHYIDAAHLGGDTDAVGDMNVMTTYDPNWCVDMSGTNFLGVTGPVHTYAKYPAGTDVGLIIYNGLDQDYQSSYYADAELRKIWLFELRQPVNPSNLPCGFTVVGITLSPPSAENEIGQNHTVTAALADLLGNPQPGVAVTFSIVSGPNAGASGTCSANADCTTDASGQVSFTYAGQGGVGTDQIQASFTDQTGTVIYSQMASKDWVLPPNVPPDCSDAAPSVTTIWPPNNKFVPIQVLGVTDPDGDPVSIVIDSIWQDEPVDTFGDGRFVPDGQGVGTATAEVRAERSGTAKVPGDGRVYHIGFTASDGQGGTCSGEVLVGVPHDLRGEPPVDGGALYDSTQTSP